MTRHPPFNCRSSRYVRIVFQRRCAGHNGLTNAAYLAKAGLDVLVVEKNPWIGGASVSRSLYPGWTYSNCSYVCSLFRPEIYRDLELAAPPRPASHSI